MLHAAISPTGAPLSFFTLTYRSRLSVRFLPTTISRFIAPPSPTVVHASSRPRRQSILKRWPRIAIYTCFYPVRSLPAPREPFRRKKPPACAAHKQTPLHHRSFHPQQDSSITIILPSAQYVAPISAPLRSSSRIALHSHSHVFNTTAIR